MATEVKLHISDRLKSLLPPLTADEQKQLEANLLADGRVLDPILFWHDGKRNVIVDGMHRFPIAQKHDLLYQVKRLELGDSWEKVERWVFDHQTGRRNLSRDAIGKWYNTLKARWGGAKSKVANATLVGDTAAQVAKKTGKHRATVVRAGQRVGALDKCTEAVRKGVETHAFRLSDADVQTLSKLSSEQQNTIATDLRKGQAKSVAVAMKLRDIAPPKKPKPKKPPKKLDRGAYFKQWEQAIGPVVRLVDKIAQGVGEEDSIHKDGVLDWLQKATDEIKEWMKVS